MRENWQTCMLHLASLEVERKTVFFHNVFSIVKKHPCKCKITKNCALQDQIPKARDLGVYLLLLFII